MPLVTILARNAIENDEALEMLQVLLVMVLARDRVMQLKYF